MNVAERIRELEELISSNNEKIKRYKSIDYWAIPSLVIFVFLGFCGFAWTWIVVLIIVCFGLRDFDTLERKNTDPSIRLDELRNIL